MLGDGLSASERPRNAGGTAFCNREHAVDGALTGDKRLIRRQFLVKRTRHAYRPFLHKREFYLFALIGAKRADLVGNGIIALV